MNKIKYGLTEKIYELLSIEIKKTFKEKFNTENVIFDIPTLMRCSASYKTGYFDQPCFKYNNKEYQFDVEVWTYNGTLKDLDVENLEQNIRFHLKVELSLSQTLKDDPIISERLNNYFKSIRKQALEI